MTARSRIPLAALMRAYRVAQADYWEHLFDMVWSIEASDKIKLGVIRSVTTFYLAMVDRLAGMAAEEFTRERERVLRRRGIDRLANLRNVLAGGTADLLAADGYDAVSTHMGIVATGSDSRTAVRTIASEFDTRLLSVDTEEGTQWAWFAASPRTLGRACVALAANFPLAGCLLGVGRPHTGSTGFRTTHREAQMAYELARTLDRPLTLYSDVALEALAGRDEAAAQRFAQGELGGLLEDTRRAEQQRETLLCYLSHGQNTASTATELYLSPRTVSYRLRRIEEILGTEIAGRSAELHTALRLHALRSRAAP